MTIPTKEEREKALDILAWHLGSPHLEAEAVKTIRLALERIKDLEAQFEASERQLADARTALREHVEATDKANKVYLDEIRDLLDEADRWKQSHAGQQQNTLAFMDDLEKMTAQRDELLAACDVAYHSIECISCIPGVRFDAPQDGCKCNECQAARKLLKAIKKARGTK